MINKIKWEKYYTDSCPAPIIILVMLRHRKKWTITWRQTTSLHDSAQMLVRNSVSYFSGDCFQSARHQTDEILHSGQRNWSLRFSKTAFECCRCLRLWAGTYKYRQASRRISVNIVVSIAPFYLSGKSITTTHRRSQDFPCECALSFFLKSWSPSTYSLTS